MSSVNKVIILGYLGRDPEIRYTKSGTAVCNLSVATTRSYRNRSGEGVSETEWHRVVTWDKQAESCNQYLAKGRQVYVEGRLQTKKYTDHHGDTKYSTEVVAESVQFLGGGEDRKSRRNEPEYDDRRTPEKQAESGRRYLSTGDDYTPEPENDDIPF